MNHVADDIEIKILNRLTEFQSESHRVLFACNYGSRAGNYPSPDSDYDVRFVYRKPLRDYVSVPVPGTAHKHNEDTVSLDLVAGSDTFDLHGWDIRKLTWLIFKSNYHALEFLFSNQMFFLHHQMNFYRETVSEFFTKNYGALFIPYVSSVDKEESPLFNLHLLLRAAFVADCAQAQQPVFSSSGQSFDLLSLTSWYDDRSGKKLLPEVEAAVRNHLAGKKFSVEGAMNCVGKFVCNDKLKSLTKGASILPTQEQYKKLDHLTYQLINL